MAVERLTDVKSVAEFLGAPEGEVMQLLEENRLGGTLVATLRRRGVPVTPRVKNSVGTVVRALSPVHGGAEAGRHEAPLAGSESTVTNNVHGHRGIHRDYGPTGRPACQGGARG